MGFWSAALSGTAIKEIPIIDLVVAEKKKSKNSLYSLDEALDWRSEVKQILSMLSPQYVFNPNDWHNEIQSYISYYANKPRIIYCCQYWPSSKKIQDVIAYYNNFCGAVECDVLVAIKQSDVEEKKEELDGYVIQYLSKDKMLDSLVDFEDYFLYLNEQYYENEISDGDEYRLQDIYVESDCDEISLKNEKESAGGKSISNVENYLYNWASNKHSDKQIVLLGEYGQGKSALSLKFAINLIESHSKRIPIIIELRGKSPRNQTLVDIIASWAARFSLNVKAIQKLLQEGRLVIILEGFDELDLVGDKLRRLEHFKRLWEFARYKKSKVMITGRPNLFLNNKEARDYLHLDNDSSSLFQVIALHLKPFTKEKIQQALRSNKNNIAFEIIELYDKCGSSNGFCDLISRPSTLYQTSVIWNNLDKDSLTSAKVIKEFINHAYRRQEEKLRSIGPTGVEESVLTLSERNYFMQGVAVAMVKLNGYTNQISELELRDIVCDLFCEIPYTVSNDRSASLGERIDFDENGIDSVFNDVRTAGILVRDLTGMNSFKFAHKSFLEFLFANFCVGLINKNEDELTFNTISKAIKIEGDLYKLDFSDEVIGYITELVLSNTDKFESAEALQLIKRINPKLPLFDKYIYRRCFGVSVLDSVFMIMYFMMVYFIFVSKGPQTTTSALSFLLSMGFPLFVYLHFTHRIKTIFAKNNLASFKIWNSACDKYNFDIYNSQIISNELCGYLSKNYRGFGKIIDKVILYNERVLEFLFDKLFFNKNKNK